MNLDMYLIIGLLIAWAIAAWATFPICRYIDRKYKEDYKKRTGMDYDRAMARYLPHGKR